MSPAIPALGDEVVALGYPLDATTLGVTRGIISSLRTDGFLQTDAALNPGNSGGPLATFCGEVVGLNSAKDPRGEAIGLAIPMETVSIIVPALVAGTRGEANPTEWRFTANGRTACDDFADWWFAEQEFWDTEYFLPPDLLSEDERLVLPTAVVEVSDDPQAALIQESINVAIELRRESLLREFEAYQRGTIARDSRTLSRNAADAAGRAAALGSASCGGMPVRTGG
jgi:hypothetical protein